MRCIPWYLEATGLHPASHYGIAPASSSLACPGSTLPSVIISPAYQHMEFWVAGTHFDGVGVRTSVHDGCSISSPDAGVSAVLMRRGCGFVRVGLVLGFSFSFFVWSFLPVKLPVKGLGCYGPEKHMK